MILRHSWLASMMALSVSVSAAGQAPQPRALAPMPGAPAGVTAFVNVTVVPMDTDRVLPGHTVVVQGDRIVAMGPVATIPVPAGATRIEGQGKFLMPGLADMHTHPCAAPCTPTSTSLERIAAELKPYLANGVTMIRDMHSGGPDSPMLGARQAVERGEILGPRLHLVGDPENYAKHNGESAEMAAASTALLKGAGFDFVKYNGWKGAVYDSVVAVAHRTGLRLAGHMPPDRKLEAMLQDGWATVDHMTGYLQYVMGLDGQWDMMGLFGMDMEALASQDWMQDTYAFPKEALRKIAGMSRDARVWNCPTLFIASGTQAMLRGRIAAASSASEKDWAFVRVLERMEDFHLRITKALQDAGAGILLCTDGTTGGGPIVAPIPGFVVHQELQLLVHAGLTPYQALATGTRNAAAFLGITDSAGTVTVGKRADLVLLNGNPLIDIRATRRPAAVMVRGQVLPATLFAEAKAQMLEQFAYYPPDLLEQYFPELVAD